MSDPTAAPMMALPGKILAPSPQMDALIAQAQMMKAATLANMQAQTSDPTAAPMMAAPGSMYMSSAQMDAKIAQVKMQAAMNPPMPNSSSGPNGPNGPGGPPMLPSVFVKTFSVDSDGYYLPQVITTNNSQHGLPVPSEEITQAQFKALVATQPDRQDPLTLKLLNPETWGRYFLVSTPLNNPSIAPPFPLLQYDGVGWYLPLMEHGSSLFDRPQPAELLKQIVFATSATEQVLRAQTGMYAGGRGSQSPQVPADFLPAIQPSIPGLLTLKQVQTAWAKAVLQNSQCSDALNVKTTEAQTAHSSLELKTAEVTLAGQKIQALSSVVTNILQHNRAANQQAAQLARHDPNSAVQLLVSANNSQIQAADVSAETWSSASIKTSYAAQDVVVACLLTAVLAGAIGSWYSSKHHK
jgi:hypothetical protein